MHQFDPPLKGQTFEGLVVDDFEVGFGVDVGGEGESKGKGEENLTGLEGGGVMVKEADEKQGNKRN